MSQKWTLFGESLKTVLGLKDAKGLPKSSFVLSQQLRQRNYPEWTAWLMTPVDIKLDDRIYGLFYRYVPYKDVRNDLWGQSHFNHDVDGVNYHVLRTGAFPFVKFHVSKRPRQDLALEDAFYRVLKVLNLGVPTLAYGVAGLLWAKHSEEVTICDGKTLTVYFWYQETKNARF